MLCIGNLPLAIRQLRCLAFSASVLCGTTPLVAAECPPNSMQSLTGTMAELMVFGDSSWVASVADSSPCAVSYVKGKGAIPAACGVGADRFKNKKFSVRGRVDSLGAIEATSLQCIR